MYKALSQMKIIIILLTGTLLLNILLWIVSDVELYGHNYMTKNVKLVLGYCFDVYAIFLFWLTNFLILVHRGKKDVLTHILRYGMFAFMFLLVVRFCDLRLVTNLHEAVSGDISSLRISFWINNIAYFLTTVYFVLLSFHMYTRSIKLASGLCALSQVVMWICLDTEFHLFNIDTSLPITLVVVLSETLVCSAFIMLAYTLYRATKRSFLANNADE